MPGSDLELAILGFGCMRLPTLADGKIDEPLATRMLRHAIDQGVNYVDTAWPYHDGESEPVVGRALGDGYRDRVQLATKLPSWAIQSRNDMDRTLGEQLARLRTDRIDHYLIHAIGRESWDRLDKLGIRSFIESALADGRIRHIGFSTHDILDGVKYVIDSYDWDFCQLQYNYVDETYQAGTEGVKYAAARGLGIVAMEPLRGGMLAKVIADVARIWARASVQRSGAEWALRWVWNHPEIAVVLSGMSDFTQVEDNLRFAEHGVAGSLSAQELALFAEVKAQYASRTRVGCTTCAYCMPCPSGVDIPECFAQYNAVSMFDDEAHARRIYGFRTAGGGAASLCTECGQCLEACPQHIPIPDRLREVAALFGK